MHAFINRNKGNNFVLNMLNYHEIRTQLWYVNSINK